MEKMIKATSQELAEYLFKNRDTLPTVDFSAGVNDWNYEIAVISFADTYMVLGNYYGGGSPFCYDLDHDEDSSELEEAISGWFSEVGCGAEVYL